MAWQIVHDHIIADAFRSKKSLSVLLAYEQQAYKSDANQVAIQMLIITFFIYIFFLLVSASAIKC